MILYIYLTVLGICFLSSLISFRLDYEARLKLLSVMMGITFCTEAFSILVTPTIHLGNNLALYNAYFLVETFAFAAYFYLLLPSSRLRTTIIVFAVLFPCWWAYSTFFIFGVTHWNSYIVITETVFCLAMSFIFYFRLFTAEVMIRLQDSPDFWIVTGMIVYFACQLPIGGTLNFLNSELIKEAQKFVREYEVLNILLYIMFTYAFLCRIITKRSS